MNQYDKHWQMNLLGVLLAGMCLILTACGAVDPVTVTPVPRSDAWWQQRHNAINERVKQGHVDLLFIGDSITHGWELTGSAVWKQYYEGRNAVNLGIGGDGTQQVLWRLDNGNIDGIHPKAAVVLIGTNNFASSSRAIAQGVCAVVKNLREQLPRTRILLLAIFPRDDISPKYQQRLKCASLLYSRLAMDPMVKYMNIGKVFLDKDGVLQQEIMPDLLHLSERGYQLWAEAIEPHISKTLAE